MAQERQHSLLWHMKRRLKMDSKAVKFDNIVAFAEEALQRDPALLLDLVKLLGREFQAERSARVLKARGDLAESPRLPYDQVWFPSTEPITAQGESLFSLQTKMKVDESHTVHLDRDLVIPLAWNRERLLETLTNIGPGRLSGPWTQDPTNHQVELWLPTRVAWVRGGNHSIATGIIRGEGEIETRSVYDFTELYNHVECDGTKFKRKHDGETLAPVKNVEWAAIFEIGRLLVETRQDPATAEHPL